METSTFYRSKKDPRIVLIIALAGLALACAAAYQVFANGIGHPPSWILILSFLFYFAVIMIFVYPVSYQIAPPNLIIRSGMTRFRIALSSIESVQPTRNPASSPALSLDRLRISYHHKGKPASTLISPQNKRAFLKELVATSDPLQLKNGEVIRLSGIEDT
jgi:hypothetical protein